MRPPFFLMVRDTAVIALAVVAWLASRQLQDAGSAFTWPAAIAAGLLIPLAGFFVHEWGHLLGALRSGARVEYPDTVWAIFLFRFDVVRSDRRQFLAMSNGGFITSVLFIALLLSTLSLHYIGDIIALALSGLGVLATFVLELPVAWKVSRGAPLPTGAAFVSEPRN
ncbi:MAG: hypothetical protein ACREVL_02575 [Solimonas sp.]